MAETPNAKRPNEIVGGLRPNSFHKGSTLAMGAPWRLVYVAVAIATLWLCVWWALR